MEDNNNIMRKYEEVFEDCVKSYLEYMEEKNKIVLEDRDIKNIAYKLIYKNEYIWEVINETIDYYIGEELKRKEERNEAE